MKAKRKEEAVTTIRIKKGGFHAYILGMSPIICNAMSAKAKQQLLLPPKRKNLVERATTLKHDPMEEFRSSFYKSRGNNEPTRVLLHGGSFKGAMKEAALRMPGVQKKEVGQLVYVEGSYTPLYGVPELFMSITRSADINRTPDVRTRMIIPHWACELQISYADPVIKGSNVLDLLAFAGSFMGVGDWRPEKGSGSYGLFTVLDEPNKQWNDIVKHGGRVAQDRAIANPTPHDEETSELLSWFETESDRRGFSVVKAA